jgi:cysteine desulfurase
MMHNNISIYLDYHSTTPCDPQVIQAMLPYLGRLFGNPSSSIHRVGREASEAVEIARAQIAESIGAEAKEIIFTAGATESNNLAIQGLTRGYIGDRNRILTSVIEHKSVLNPIGELGKKNFDVVFLPVSREGIIDLEEAKNAITENTLLISAQIANNEIGVIQPIEELARLAHENGVLVHCDAAQAVGKIPLDVGDWGIDLLSMSAHKLYGPKGIGALYIRGGPYALPIKPLLLGGGQEYGLRSGTLNVPAIVGFGEACRICAGEMPEEAERISNLRDHFEGRILNAIENTHRNGAVKNRLPNNSSLTFPGIDAEALIVNTPELAISMGSACASGAPEPSHVLLAIGLSREEAYSTIRIGLGRFTTDAEIEKAADLIIQAVMRLREIQSKL